LKARIDKDSGLTGDSRRTVGWFIENRWVPLREGNWRSSTRATNLQTLRYITEKFGDVALDAVDPVELQIWVNGLAKKFSGSLVKHVRIFLKSIFAEAVEQDFLHKSSARSLKVPNLKDVPKPYLSVDEVKRLLAAATGRDRVLLRLMLVTGLRPSELFALRWSSLDETRRCLSVTESVYRGEIRPFTKTTHSGSRKELMTVFLPDPVVADLVALKASQPQQVFGGAEMQATYFIFRNRKGFIYKENYQVRVLNLLAKKAKISHVNFQILRRTVATLAQQLGSPKDIAGILRHKNVDTAALHYTQQMDETVRGTAEKLAELLY